MRTRIFDQIIYVGILHMYTIIHILLAHFLITGTIKYLETQLKNISKQNQHQNSSIKRNQPKHNHLCSIFTTPFILDFVIYRQRGPFHKYLHQPLRQRRKFPNIISKHNHQQKIIIIQNLQQRNHFRVIFTTRFIIDIVVARRCGHFCKHLHQPLRQRRWFPCPVLVSHQYYLIARKIYYHNYYHQKYTMRN